MLQILVLKMQPHFIVILWTILFNSSNKTKFGQYGPPYFDPKFEITQMACPQRLATRNLGKLFDIMHCKKLKKPWAHSITICTKMGI